MTRRYGASPVHFAVHALALALAGWAVLQLAGVRRADDVLAWFLGALLLHDLVVLPCYSLLDRAAARVTRGPAINHVRVPAALSALLLAVWSPTIFGWNDATFARVAGFTREGVPAGWLWLTTGLFAVSGALWLIRRRRPARVHR
jgi:hypothetical protein